jgi:type II secretory pathway component PulF
MISFAVVVVMMVYVVPKLLELFSDADDLPAVTQALIATSDFFIYSWPYLIGGGIAIVFFIKTW